MIDLVDIQCGFGGSAPGVRQIVEPESIVEQLRRHRISTALVRITPESLDFDIPHSNERLYEACATHTELKPCPVVAPSACGDLLSEETQVAEAMEHGAGAVVLRPGPDCWSPERWVVAPLLEALEALRMPVICLERLVSFSAVALLAEMAPSLPLIITGTSYRNHRTLIPVMKTFPNTFLSIGNTFTAHHGIEFYVSHLGAERLLFGTGLPDSEPGAAIGQLLFSEISEEECERIGAGNFRRLQEDMCR